MTKASSLRSMVTQGAVPEGRIVTSKPCLAAMAVAAAFTSSTPFVLSIGVVGAVVAAACTVVVVVVVAAAAGVPVVVGAAAAAALAAMTPVFLATEPSG